MGRGDGKGLSLVLLFLQILDCLALLFQGFVRRKDVGSVQLQSETMLPAEKDLSILFFSGSMDEVRGILELGGLCEVDEIFGPIAGSHNGF